MMKPFFALFTLMVMIESSALAKGFELKSKTIQQNGKMKMEQVFNGFGCSGQNLSPDLSWDPGPEGTKSYAVTVYDPDAPTGSGWWHWVIFNIPNTVHELPKGLGTIKGIEAPEGSVQSMTDFGKSGYGGPCPPPGKPHRYIFTVFALKDTLKLEPNSPAAMVGFYLNQNKLAEAQLTTTFGR